MDTAAEALSGRIALVTGGGRNIGRATALVLAQSGAQVIVAYHRDEEAADRVVEEVESFGGRALAVAVNVADPDSSRRTVASLADRGLRVDILISNAAVRPQRSHADITRDEWDLVHATNLRGPFFLAQAVLPHMRAQGWGRIALIGGIDAYKGTLLRAHVVASKLGLVGLARALANEVARSGVTVNVVVPGLIDTVRHEHVAPDIDTARVEGLDRVPMARLGRAEDVARACRFLVSDDAAFITGQELFVTGGAPPLVRQPGRESAV